MVLNKEKEVRRLSGEDVKDVSESEYSYVTEEIVTEEEKSE